jgi:CHASE1-domain containing sensor protein
MEEVRSRSDEAQQRLLEQQATLKADLLEAQLERDDAAKLLQASQASCSALSAQTADLEAQLMQAYEKSVDVEAKAAAQVGSLFCFFC